MIGHRIRGKAALWAAKVKAKIRGGAVIQHGVADLAPREPLERNGRAKNLRAQKLKP